VPCYPLPLPAQFFFFLASSPRRRKGEKSRSSSLSSFLPSVLVPAAPGGSRPVPPFPFASRVFSPCFPSSGKKPVRRLRFLFSFSLSHQRGTSRRKVSFSHSSKHGELGPAHSFLDQLLVAIFGLFRRAPSPSVFFIFFSSSSADLGRYASFLLEESGRSIFLPSHAVSV